MSANITHLSDFTHMSTNISHLSGNTNISSDFQTSQFQTSQCTEMSVIFVFFTTSMHLNATSTMFVAYGATQYLPVIGQTRLRLGNQRGRRLDTTAYVTKDKDESLLGKEDAMALSILCQDLEGGPPLDHHHHSRTPSPAHTIKKQRYW